MNRSRSIVSCLPLAALGPPAITFHRRLVELTSARIFPTLAAAAFLVCITGAMPVRAVAAPPADAGLTAGMGYSDVIHLKGPATSKEELESKREDLWSYPGIVLTFHEGKLSKWRTVDAKSPLIYAAPPAALAASAAVQVAPPTEALPSSSGAQTVDDLAKGVKPKDKARVAGLISEIMKELPADDTAGGTGSGGPPSPPMGMLPTDIVRAPR